MAKLAYRNLDGTGPQGFKKVIRWALLDRLTGRRVRHPPGPPASAVDRPAADLEKPPAEGEPARITWLGHASWLLQLDGVSLVIDPVLGKSISGVVPRLAALPIGVKELPPIQATLITHAHRDHLDLPTVRRIGAKVITGCGVGTYLKRIAREELGWWQSTQVGKVQVTFVPSQHWSNRGFGDLNRALWGGFVVQGTTASIYHSGDTAYFDGFSEIGRRFPDLSAALLPIGAYEPEWFMRKQHMNPEDAVRAFVDLGAEQFFAMHWGTFRLTDEPLAEPVERLRKIWKERGLTGSRAHVLQVGESATLPRRGP